MAAIDLPLHPMEHQYLVTEEVPEIAAMLDAGGEHPHVMDPAGESYLRQEGRGLCIGFYEQTLPALGGGWHTLGALGRTSYQMTFDKIEDKVLISRTKDSPCWSAPG
jgi:dimethylglycine dehydrogenase